MSGRRPSSSPRLHNPVGPNTSKGAPSCSEDEGKRAQLPINPIIARSSSIEPNSISEDRTRSSGSPSPSSSRPSPSSSHHIYYSSFHSSSSSSLSRTRIQDAENKTSDPSFNRDCNVIPEDRVNPENDERPGHGDLRNLTLQQTATAEEFESYVRFLNYVEIQSRENKLEGGGSPFQCESIPKIGVADYLCHFSKTISFSGSVYTVALIFLDRALGGTNQLILSPLTIHRLSLVSILVSAKLMEDVHPSNKEFAEVGGVSTEELYVSELHFLDVLKFDLAVGETDYKEGREYLMNAEYIKEDEHE